MFSIITCIYRCVKIEISSFFIRDSSYFSKVISMHYAPWVIAVEEWEIYLKSPKPFQSPRLKMTIIWIFHFVTNHHPHPLCAQAVSYGLEVIYFVIRSTPLKLICNKSRRCSSSFWKISFYHNLDKISLPNQALSSSSSRSPLWDLSPSNMSSWHLSPLRSWFVFCGNHNDPTKLEHLR